MFMITDLIKPRLGKLRCNYLIGNNRPEFHNGPLDIYFFKLALGSDCSELCSELSKPPWLSNITKRPDRKQNSVWSNVFWQYIYYESLFNKKYIKAQMLKKFPSNKINVTKIDSFTFNSQFLYELKWEIWEISMQV